MAPTGVSTHLTPALFFGLSSRAFFSMLDRRIFLNFFSPQSETTVYFTLCFLGWKSVLTPRLNHDHSLHISDYWPLSLLHFNNHSHKEGFSATSSLFKATVAHCTVVSTLTPFFSPQLETDWLRASWDEKLSLYREIILGPQSSYLWPLTTFSTSFWQLLPKGTNHRQPFSVSSYGCVISRFFSSLDKKSSRVPAVPLSIYQDG